MGTRRWIGDTTVNLLGKEEIPKIYLRSFGMRGEPHAGGSMKEIVGDQRRIVLGGRTSAQLLWGIGCAAKNTQGKTISEEEKGGKIYVKCI